MGEKAQLGTFMGYDADTKGDKVLLNGNISLCRGVRLFNELRGPETAGIRWNAAGNKGAGGGIPRPSEPQTGKNCPRRASRGGEGGTTCTTR